jgi:hypothetical protein
VHRCVQLRLSPHLRLLRGSFSALLMMLADALVFTILSSSFPSVVSIKTRPFLFLFGVDLRER